MSFRRLAFALFAFAAACAGSHPAAQAQVALTIIPTFDSTINNDPNATTIKNTINQVIAVYEARFTTKTATTVNITFKEMGSGLGQSSTFIGTVSYSDYRSALASHATTADDTTAVNSLQTGSSVTINGTSFSTVAISTATGRALGFTGFNVASDGTVSLRTSIMNLSRTGTQDPSKYDLFAVAAHEIDEVLGFGSAVGGGFSAGTLRPQDLFRNDSAGNRSFTSSSTAQAFFSIDKTTQLVRFNQDSTGDFGDWYSPSGHTPVRVQDAFATPGTQPDLNVELTGLDVIGYDLVPVPEPGLVLGVAVAGLGAVAGLRRRLGRRPGGGGRMGRACQPISTWD
jgi:hypothetical protein